MSARVRTPAIKATKTTPAAPVGGGTSWWRALLKSPRAVPAALGMVAVVWAIVFYQVLSQMDLFTPTQLQLATAPPATAFPLLTSMAHRNQYFWGSYRPQVYFGLRTRQPQGLVFGMMWLRGGSRLDQLRHTCEQSDGLHKYGWQRHDGEFWGEQQIVDNGLMAGGADLQLTTSFVKDPGLGGGHWAVRVRGQQQQQRQQQQQTKRATSTTTSLFFYFLNENGWPLQYDAVHSKLPSVKLQLDRRATFQLGFTNIDAVGDVDLHYWGKRTMHVHNLSQQTRDILASTPPAVDGTRILPSQLEDPDSNFVMWQLVIKNPSQPFVADLRFFHGDPSYKLDNLVGDALSAQLNERRGAFNERFERTFALKTRGYNDSLISFAQAALANLVGGVGYFYGPSLVQLSAPKKTGAPTKPKEPLEYPSMPLLTAVPSRSFFPRGFLWDEGFHQLLIGRWSPELSMDIIAHWLDLMNKKGWIPREQILGTEARSKVPAEFIVQRPENANPPTLLLPLLGLTRTASLDSTSEAAKFLEHIFPRLELWLRWYQSTQAGPVPKSFRWRGRDEKTTAELNPKTLTSGLDDYPRASHPSDSERHIDLLCWMILATNIMRQVPHVDTREWHDLHTQLSDTESILQLHWHEQAQMFADWGNHTENVRLERRPGHNGLKRVTFGKPREQYVAHIGYVSFFPLMLQLLDPASPQLGKLFEDLIRPDLLWTPYGLRSLAQTSSLYMKHNTEHDPPYWRGPIWINMNYLVLRGLYHYASLDGPHRATAHEIYTRLRENVVSNVFQQYQKTGFLWENYHPDTGVGQGCYPFTGWTTLVVLMMADSYP